MQTVRTYTGRVWRLTRDARFVVTAVVLATIAIAPHRSLAASAASASAEEHWESECGSCHVAYPPRLLTAPAWHRIMSGLDRHFGADASTDATTAAEIAAYLERHAGTGRRASDTLRITEGTWFQRKHEEVRTAIWKRPSVKNPANCSACHTDADRGEFRKRAIRIPQ
jgi:nitrate/TMAO reductase-like tetraheme cytochrome c subunit